MDKIILTNGSIFNNFEICGTFVPYKNNQQKLKIKNIQHTDELAVKFQLQMELQQNVIMKYKPGLTYKFDCLVNNVKYSNLFIQTIDFLEPVNGNTEQRYTITLMGCGLDIPVEVV